MFDNAVEYSKLFPIFLTLTSKLTMYDWYLLNVAFLSSSRQDLPVNPNEILLIDLNEGFRQHVRSNAIDVVFSFF